MGSACPQTARDRPCPHRQRTSHRGAPPSLPRGPTHSRSVGHGAGQRGLQQQTLMYLPSVWVLHPDALVVSSTEHAWACLVFYAQLHLSHCNTVPRQGCSQRQFMGSQPGAVPASTHTYPGCYSPLHWECSLGGWCSCDLPTSTGPC